MRPFRRTMSACACAPSPIGARLASNRYLVMMSLMGAEFGRRRRAAQGRVERARPFAFALLLSAASCVHLPSSPPRAADYWGFAAPWDARSLASIREHPSQLAVVVS